MREKDTRIKALESNKLEMDQKIKKMKKTIKDKDEEIQSRDNTIKEMENYTKDLRDEIAHLTQLRDHDRAEMESADDYLNNIKEQDTKNREEISRMKKMIDDLRRKLKETENINDELIQKITRERSPKAPQSNTIKQKILIIGDSNTKRIAPYLSREYDWKQSNNTYRSEDIGQVKTSEKYEVVVILIGTNNIKNGEDGEREGSKLIRAAKELKLSNHILVCEIPPINRRHSITERKIFNRYVNNKIKEEDCLHTVRTPKDTENSPVEDTLTDDLHLNPHHAKLLAEEINKRVDWYTRTTHATSNTQTSRRRDVAIEAHEEDIKAIIGKQHIRIREIEDRHRVKVMATRINPGKITVSGEERGTREAVKEIKERIKELEEKRKENTSLREERIQIPCKFYQQGRCQRGNKCRYQHEKAERNTRERSKSQDNQPTRYRSRSKERTVIPPRESRRDSPRESRRDFYRENRRDSPRESRRDSHTARQPHITNMHE